MFFSAITKNSNWDILTKNLVILKDKMGLRMENFNFGGIHWKVWFLGGTVHENRK